MKSRNDPRNGGEVIRLPLAILTALWVVAWPVGNATAQPCSNPLQDGSFEGGTPSTDWVEGSWTFGTPICDLNACGLDEARTGDWWAWFGGMAVEEYGWLDQTVTIPAGATAVLNFYLSIDTASGNGQDVFSVFIDFNDEVFFAYESDQRYSSGYTLVQVDLSPYADGQEHVVSLEGWFTGEIDFTSFFVDDVWIDVCSYSGVYVLDGFGGVHAGGAASPMSPLTPYFGFDVAEDFELATLGFYVLDGFGGVHAGGGAPVMSPGTPYFGFDITKDLEIASTGYYVLDGFGGVHAGGGAAAMSPLTPYFGFDVARDLELSESGFYVLDGFGGVHAGGGAPVRIPASTYFGFDIAKDLELTYGGYYVLDGHGGIHAGGGMTLTDPSTPYFGFDVAQDLEVAGKSFYVLDRFGGLHPGGDAVAMSPGTPYFGFDITKDFELK